MPRNIRYRRKLKVSDVLEVVERKQAEKALLEKEEKYHVLLDKLPIGIALIDCDTSQIIDCNVEFERHTGRDVDELRKMRMWEVIHPRNLDSFKQEFLKVGGEQEYYSTEQEILKPDGGIIVTRIDSCRIEIGNQEFIHTTVYDITERKKVEDALRESEEFNSSLLDNSPSPILVHNPDTSLIYVNHAFEELTGFSAAEVLGKQAPHPWWSDETKIKSRAGLIRRLHSTKTRTEEIFRKKSGEKILVEINSRPIKINGRFRHLLSSWVDITERKQSEDALRESEQFNASLLSNSPNPVFVMNPDTSIRYVNPALEELTGFSASELIGQRAPYPWWLEENIEKDTEQVKKVLLGGEWKVEKRIKTKSGDRIWIQITSTSVRENDNIKYLISNWVDITQRKRAEERLVKLNEELRGLSAHLESIRESERARIAREIHDELGQSLAALKMDVCWLADNLTSSQANLRELTESMAKLIDITVQRIKRLCIELRPKLLDDIGIGGTIEWLAKEFEKATGISCHTVCNLDEKSLDNERATAVFRIFQEALTNVYRHSKATRVLIELNKEDNKAVLKVNDNGMGIKKGQISSPQSLGLIGMRERIHHFGGELEIDGINNVGTNLTVRIPLSKETS